MSSSPFMDDYSSEDYSDHDDDFYFVPVTATSPEQVRAQVEIQTQSNELQNLIIDQQEDVSESVYFDVLPELEGGEMEQSIYLALESYFDLEAEAETTGVAAALETETVVEELTVESCFDLEAQAETGVAAALEAETTVEELTVESCFDLEAQAETGVAASLEAETTVEELTVESCFDLEAQTETGVAAALEAETVLDEGDVIESESLETVEADNAGETVERMIKEFIYEAVDQSESDLEVEGAIDLEPNSDVEHEADPVTPEAETAVEEGDVIGDSIYEASESDYELDAETEDMVEEEDDMVEEEEDMIEEEDDMVEEEDDMIEEEDDFVEEEHAVIDEGDTIDEPLESYNNPQAEAEALVEEGAAMEESIYEPLESNSDLQAEAPEALAEPAAVSIEMTTFKAQEPDSDLEPEEPEDLIDEQLDSCEEESDLSEEEWDSDAEESDMDPEDSDMDSSSDSDLTEAEEDDDVVVSYFKSSTAIRNKAWKILVPASALAWAKLPVVTDVDMITTLEDHSNSSLRESFLGHCSPMLRLQECGNAVINAIETLLCELLRIRNGLRRVFGALFRKGETTKHA